MMKPKFAFWGIAFVLALSSCQSCKKQVEPDLPPETQTGAGTFGCKVNGKVWLPKGKPNIFASSLQVIYDEGYFGNLDIRAYNKDYDEYLSINAFNVYSEMIFNINTPPADSLMQQIRFSSNDCSYNYGEAFYRNGKLRVTKLDKQKRIITGTFECTMKRDGCDTLKITEGRFDLKY